MTSPRTSGAHLSPHITDEVWRELTQLITRSVTEWGALDAWDKARLRLEWREARIDHVLRSSLMDELLWVALIGGTNVGKSTIFNLICNKSKSVEVELSPALVTAGATKYPLVRLPQSALSGFTREATIERSPLGVLTRLDNPQQLVTPQVFSRPHDFERAQSSARGAPPIYVSPHALIDTPRLGGDEHILRDLALVDCPDHDSDRLENADVADHVADRADVCVYITTPQKYRSLSVIKTIAALLDRGREVWVLFNKVEPALLSGPSPAIDDLWRDLRGEVGARCEGVRFLALGAIGRAPSRAALSGLTADLTQAFSPLLARSPRARKRSRHLARSTPRIIRLYHAGVSLLAERKRDRDTLLDLTHNAIMTELSAEALQNLRALYVTREASEDQRYLDSVLARCLGRRLSESIRILKRFQSSYIKITLNGSRRVLAYLGVSIRHEMTPSSKWMQELTQEVTHEVADSGESVRVEPRAWSRSYHHRRLKEALVRWGIHRSSLEAPLSGFASVSASERGDLDESRQSKGQALQTLFKAQVDEAWDQLTLTSRDMGDSGADPLNPTLQRVNCVLVGALTAGGHMDHAQTLCIELVRAVERRTRLYINWLIYAPS